MSLLKGQAVVHTSSIVALALVLPAVVAGLLLLNEPLILLIAGGGVCAAAIVLLLLQRPLIALQVALFFYLFPIGLRPVEAGLAQDILTNGAIGLAICAWTLHAPSQRRPILWNWVCFLMALFILWAIITLLWAPDLTKARHALVAYSIGFILLFLVVQQVRSPHAIDGLMRVLAMIGWTMVISGVLTVLITGYHPGERLKVFNVNENYLGVILILVLPGVIWPVLGSSGVRRGLYMALSIVYILCTLILVLLSGSRGSAISLGIMLLAFWFWKPLRPWGMVGGVLVTCMLISAPFLLDSLNNRFIEKGGNQLGGRDVLMMAGLRFIEDHPLTGAGLGNGAFELTPYIAALTSDYDHRNDLPVHNPVVEVGVDTGLIGMFVYLSICAAALWQFFCNRSRWYLCDGALVAYFPIVLCSAISYLASFIKGGGFEADPTFFLLLALLIIPSQLSPDNSALKTIGRPANAPMRRLAAAAPALKVRH